MYTQHFTPVLGNIWNVHFCWRVSIVDSWCQESTVLLQLISLTAVCYAVHVVGLFVCLALWLLPIPLKYTFCNSEIKRMKPVEGCLLYTKSILYHHVHFKTWFWTMILSRTQGRHLRYFSDWIDLTELHFK